VTGARPAGLAGSGLAGSGAAAAFVPDPAFGRIFTTSRLVRMTDVTPAGRLRLDAIARYLQEAAEDDVTDSGWDEPYDWLLRRSVVTIAGFPAHRERVTVRTFCSGTGPRWAERTTTVAGPSGDLIQARAVWVAVARQTGAPAPLSPEFLAVYGESARGRKVTARLSHPAPDPALPGRPWPVRAADLDPAGHVNNTVHWAAAEEALAGAGWLPSAAEIEYAQPILPGSEPLLVVGEHLPSGLDVWLMDGGDRLVSVRLSA
jgi:acyl-ACP thioesterase